MFISQNENLPKYFLKKPLLFKSFVFTGKWFAFDLSGAASGNLALHGTQGYPAYRTVYENLFLKI